ncbi:MAG: SAM-dependent methyltransferase, partial [Acidimicrobiia bacterium]
MLSEHIIAEIRRGGPMGFDRFMEIALYDPEAGYFATGALRSDRAGDFLTSPEVSPLFGETIAQFVAAERDRIGEPFTLIEVGGGSGSLLRPLLDALDPAPSVVAVERSAAARAAIAERVPEADLAETVPALRGVVIGNELLDNMPAALVARRDKGWSERVVNIEDDRLVLADGEARPEVTAWAEAHAGPVPDGG